MDTDDTARYTVRRDSILAKTEKTQYLVNG